MYCLCVNMYCTTATRCQPNCSQQICLSICFIKESAFVYTDLCLKQVFDILTLSCDAPALSVVNGVRESAKSNVKFFQGQVGVALYPKMIVNLLIKKI